MTTDHAPRRYGELRVLVHPDADSLAAVACAQAVAAIEAALALREKAAIVLATGNSQLGFLDQLCAAPVDWTRITVLHLDEYVGISDEHPASFRRYLLEHVVERVHPAAFHPLRGDAPDPAAECARYRRLLAEERPVLCAFGIGENGHLAFNDPPADLSTTAVVHEVELDLACRRQQVNEGHFPDVDAVPTRALSMTVPAMLSIDALVGIAPERRKAAAVAAALLGPVTPACPASALQRCAQAVLHLDEDSAALIS